MMPKGVVKGLRLVARLSVVLLPVGAVSACDNGGGHEAQKVCVSNQGHVRGADQKCTSEGSSANTAAAWIWWYVAYGQSSQIGQPVYVGSTVKPANVGVSTEDDDDDTGQSGSGDDDDDPSSGGGSSDDDGEGGGGGGADDDDDSASASSGDDE